MVYKITPPGKIRGKIKLPASKSISNRLLVIKALSSVNININNLSNAEDTKTLETLLASEERTLDCGHAGTTFRFLTAYLSTLKDTRILTGSDRMKQRPIGVLVEALRGLGAEITYLEEEGFPPLQIEGRSIIGSEVTMDSAISSQFISALILIAPCLDKGLTIHLTDKVVSRPYIEMTLKALRHFGINAEHKPKSIDIEAGEYNSGNLKVEADWSSASYWYSIVALANDAEIELEGLNRASWQGDSVVAELFALLGVKTTYTKTGAVLTKTAVHAKEFGYNFINCPDLAQTVVTTTAALGIPGIYTGLETLRIKETNRVAALKSELKKVGVGVEELRHGEIACSPSELKASSAPISTFEDHRMAMSFAPLSCVLGGLTIEHPGVVAKSYRNYWEDLRSVGFVIEEV